MSLSIALKNVIMARLLQVVILLFSFMILAIMVRYDDLVIQPVQFSLSIRLELSLMLAIVIAAYIVLSFREFYIFFSMLFGFVVYTAAIIFFPMLRVSVLDVDNMFLIFSSTFIVANLLSLIVIKQRDTRYTIKTPANIGIALVQLLILWQGYHLIEKIVF